MSSGELAKKLSGSNVTTKNFQLQPKYKSITWIRVTVSSGLVQQCKNHNGLHDYDNVKEATIVRSADATVHSDFIVDICLNSEGFQEFPRMLTYQDQQMMVVVGVQDVTLLVLQTTGSSCQNLHTKVIQQQPNQQQHHQQQQQQPGKDHQTNH